MIVFIHITTPSAALDRAVRLSKIRASIPAAEAKAGSHLRCSNDFTSKESMQTEDRAYICFFREVRG